MFAILINLFSLLLYPERAEQILDIVMRWIPPNLLLVYLISREKATLKLLFF